MHDHSAVVLNFVEIKSFFLSVYAKWLWKVTASLNISVCLYVSEPYHVFRSFTEIYWHIIILVKTGQN